MEKTITISDIDITLNNNANWFFIYRNQFGHDIIPTLMPMLASTINLAAGLLEETGKSENVQIRDILAIADSDAMMNALVHLSSLEFVDFINITWSLAKNADESIPEPSKWIRQFESFPVDEIAPAVFELVIKGVTSSKNLERLQGIRDTLKPINEKTK